MYSSKASNIENNTHNNILLPHTIPIHFIQFLNLFILLLISERFIVIEGDENLKFSCAFKAICFRSETNSRVKNHRISNNIPIYLILPYLLYKLE